MSRSAQRLLLSIRSRRVPDKRRLHRRAVGLVLQRTARLLLAVPLPATAAGHTHVRASLRLVVLPMPPRLRRLAERTDPTQATPFVV